VRNESDSYEVMRQAVENVARDVRAKTLILGENTPSVVWNLLDPTNATRPELRPDVDARHVNIAYQRDRLAMRLDDVAGRHAEWLPGILAAIYEILVPLNEREHPG
jgi:hypothetical protein